MPLAPLLRASVGSVLGRATGTSCERLSTFRLRRKRATGTFSFRLRTLLRTHHWCVLVACGCAHCTNMSLACLLHLLRLGLSLTPAHRSDFALTCLGAGIDGKQGFTAHTFHVEPFLPRLLDNRASRRFPDLSGANRSNSCAQARSLYPRLSSPFATKVARENGKSCGLSYRRIEKTLSVFSSLRWLVLAKTRFVFASDSLSFCLCSVKIFVRFLAKISQRFRQNMGREVKTSRLLLTPSTAISNQNYRQNYLGDKGSAESRKSSSPPNRFAFWHSA